jgi:hypothetical protein
MNKFRIGDRVRLRQFPEVVGTVVDRDPWPSEIICKFPFTAAQGGNSIRMDSIELVPSEFTKDHCQVGDLLEFEDGDYWFVIPGGQIPNKRIVRIQRPEYTEVSLEEE